MRRGFTLLELALVLAVASLLFCIALPRLQRVADQLATRRADFAGALKSGGAKALIQQMNAIAAKAGG